MIFEDMMHYMWYNAYLFLWCPLMTYNISAKQKKLYFAIEGLKQYFLNVRYSNCLFWSIIYIHNIDQGQPEKEHDIFVLNSCSIYVHKEDGRFLENSKKYTRFGVNRQIQII